MKKFAVIGNPVKHSLSPQIHLSFAAQTGVAIEYLKLESPLDGFEKTVKWFREQGGHGCSVTVPFKSSAYAIASEIGTNAQLARAVNCLLFKEDGHSFGDNFDGIGLIEDLTQHHHYSIAHKKILIIGAGGATQGIIAPLLEKAPTEIIIANRTEKTAIELAARFSKLGPISGLALAALPPIKFDLIIHATSTGHSGQIPTLPNGMINRHTFCYDLSYGPAAQPFLQWAQQQGAQKISDGIGMLVEQAAAAFYLWLGVYPDTKPVLTQLLTGPATSHRT